MNINRKKFLVFQDLYPKNKEVLGLVEFTKNYIDQILKEENKEEFTKENFCGLKEKLEEIKKYQKIAEEIIGRKVDIGVVEKIIFGQTLEEFDKFMKNNHKVVSLIIYGKEENLKNLFKLEGFKKEILIELAENEGIVILIEYGKKEILNKVWDLFEIKTKEDLIELAKNEELLYLITNGKKEILNKVWDLFEIKTKEDLIKLAKNKEIVYLIKYGKKENLNKVWNLFEIKTKKDLIKLAKNKEIVNLIEYGKEENFKNLFKLEGFKKEMLIKLAKNKEIVYLITDCKEENFIDGIKFRINNYSFKNINNFENIKYNLFRVSSNGSKILDKLFEKIKQNKDKGMYDIMQEDSEKYLLGKKLEKVKKVVKTKQLDISLYLRYGLDQVDYPEIGEYIGTFINQYIEKGYSKYFKKIRLLPRFKDNYPGKGFFDINNKIELFNIEGREFTKVLKQGSIPLHLSHGTYDNSSENKPYVISGLMEEENDENELKLNFDLEKKFNDNYTKNKSLEEIFEEILRVLQEIEKKLDEKSDILDEKSGIMVKSRWLRWLKFFI